MEHFDENNKTLSQIHYYSNLPKHIKGRAIELVPKASNMANDGISDPAHLVSGTITVVRGKLNIPNLT